METPYSVIRRRVAASTQDVARQAFSGIPVLVVADRQESGRGRSGSQWANAPGALAMSLAIRPSWPAARWPIIPLVAGVAVTRCVPGDLKWPNDVLVAGDKVGGILVEAAGDGPVVVGVGLNLWWPEPPAGIGALFTGDPGAEAADGIATCWADHMIEVLTGSPDDWPRQEYTERCVTLGHQITWDPDGDGLATGIAPDGSLEVDTPAGSIIIRSGEVRHVRSGDSWGL